MDDYRKLAYEDKKSLNDFEVNNTNSLNNLIYAGWLIKRVEIDPLEANYQYYYLKAFNDAYYLCTLALLIPIGKEIVPYRLLKKVDNPSIVFPMVYLYLSKLPEKSVGITILLDKIETAFKRNSIWQQNYDELITSISKFDDCVNPKIFEQRHFTNDILSQVDWETITQKFKKDKIEATVRNFARSKEAWRMMVDAIKSSAQKYDYDYGFEDYTDEGIDEYGPYTRTIKVPRVLFDEEGNDISNPLKRAGVYDFCDGLMEKYDELSLSTQPMVTEPSTSLNDNTINKDNGNSCFRNVSSFVQERIKDAIEKYVFKKDAYIALLEVTLYDHNLLYERNHHKSFIRQLADWGMLDKILSGAKDKGDRLKKICDNVTHKAVKLSNKGYMEWSDSKDKTMCEQIGKLLGDKIPYSR